MKKSKTLWLLIVFFTWAALKSGGGIYGHENVSDYALLSSIGIGWVFFVTNIPIMLLEATTATLLFTRKSIAYLAGIAVVISACINGALFTAISLFNMETIKSIYIASRESRGMNVNQELLGFLFTPQGLIVSLLFYIAIYALVFYFLHRVKNELVN